MNETTRLGNGVKEGGNERYRGEAREKDGNTLLKKKCQKELALFFKAVRKILGGNAASSDSCFRKLSFAAALRFD